MSLRIKIQNFKAETKYPSTFFFWKCIRFASVEAKPGVLLERTVYTICSHLSPLQLGSLGSLSGLGNSLEGLQESQKPAIMLRVSAYHRKRIQIASAQWETCRAEPLKSFKHRVTLVLSQWSQAGVVSHCWLTEVLQELPDQEHSPEQWCPHSTAEGVHVAGLSLHVLSRLTGKVCHTSPHPSPHGHFLAGTQLPYTVRHSSQA